MFVFGQLASCFAVVLKQINLYFVDTFQGQERTKFVFQGVHETICFGPASQPWDEDEEPINQIVCIGRNLDRAVSIVRMSPTADLHIWPSALLPLQLLRPRLIVRYWLPVYTNMC